MTHFSFAAIRSTALRLGSARANGRPLLASLLCLVLLASLVGCQDDLTTVRRIQAERQTRQQLQTKVDHLGEAMNLVSRLIELDAETASRQVVYHLNAWQESTDATSPQADFKPADVLRTASDVLPLENSLQAVSQPQFNVLDVEHIKYAYLLRSVCDWVLDGSTVDPMWEPWLSQNRDALGAETANSLASTVKLFDWVTRNIALEPMVLEDQAPPVPTLPLGMQFRGAGYRQTPYQTLFRGTGDALQRSVTMIALCRQVSIPACMLGIADGAGDFKPWAVGVLLGGEIYLFDCGLGMPIAGPSQVGIATLKDARRDASVLRRMSVPGWFDYPVQKDDVQQCAAMLMLDPETLSLRFKRLQESLTGDLRLGLYEDGDAVAAEFEAVAGVAMTQIWDVPLKARLYEASLKRIAQNDPMVAFFTLAPWTILEGGFDQAQRLALGRWRHLQGRFEDDETTSIQGAKPLYLTQRQPEFEIADLRIDVELQKQYGIRRELGVTPEVYDRQIQQVQQIMRQGKNTATFWLSLIQYETGRFDLAENWFGVRVLGDQQDSRWEQSARYGLARSLERLGKLDEAIELYKTEGDIQEHGNRIRARFVARSQNAEEPSESATE